ncbi:hypothetical protein BCR33DRAFT_335332 [Rhizoclosmatium globosum]|uniref:Uncharacterized protein n=1 Tax=Rhizoclosmatium globosum TaxID=329046 RepID=A0A1Y2C3E4_9FUNG|nr:hypothetical protein BCR33DRAFT_335332 [Rhizoclosmatium globosum]|eukprot:ORY41560.1 hypothetical protein BCR33DRAFT_335332 [Rhizoclosmatium globosum]
MSLTAMIKQRDLFEASALAAAEQFNRTHHHTITIAPAAEPQNQQDPHNPQQSEYVASDDIVWDELLNFSDTSDFETDEVSSSTELLLKQQDIEITKSFLSKVPSLRESSDLINQFASLVMKADVRISKGCSTANIPTLKSLFQDNQHQPAMENVRKVLEVKIKLVDKCETEPEKDEALRILNELRDKRVKPFSPIPAHIPSTFHRIPGLETREATILIDELLFYLMEPQSLSSHSPRLLQLRQNILDMVSSDMHQAEVKVFVFLIDLILKHIPTYHVNRQ